MTENQENKTVDSSVSTDKKSVEFDGSLLDLIQGVDVKWKSLSEISSIYGGLKGKTKDDFSDGNAKFISYKNIFDNISINYEILENVKVGKDENQHEVKYGDVLFTGSSETANEAGMSSVLTLKTDEKIYLNSFSFGVRFKEHIKMNPEFSKYLFRSNFMRKEISKTASGVTRFNISKERFKRIEVPIIPLEIQQKVVEILDKMTDYVTELTTELTLRQKQYAYYRDQLLSFGVEENSLSVEWMTLGEVARLKNGSDWKNLTGGGVPVYGSGGEMGVTVGKAAYDKPTVLIPRKGSISNLFYLTTPFWNVDTIYYTKIDEEKIVPKFFYYYLKMINLEALSINPTRPSLTQAILDKVKIPVPNLIEQRRIVEILDKFDKLMSDLSEGLPREIELRQKQYEYWREQLLNFN